jgi:hypothetical protein
VLTCSPAKSGWAADRSSICAGSEIAPGTTLRRLISSLRIHFRSVTSEPDVPTGMSRAATNTVTDSSPLWTLFL